MADILIVDDDRQICRALVLLFKSAGHMARSAARSRLGMDFLCTRRPDLLILDWMMPEMSGADVLRAIRSDPRLNQLPVLVYTALSDPMTESEARRLGANDVMVKSGDWDSLYMKVMPYLGLGEIPQDCGDPDQPRW